MGFYSRNLDIITPKITYFHYLIKRFLCQSIQKNVLFNFENRSTASVCFSKIELNVLWILRSGNYHYVQFLQKSRGHLADILAGTKTLVKRGVHQCFCFQNEIKCFLDVLIQRKEF